MNPDNDYNDDFIDFYDEALTPIELLVEGRYIDKTYLSEGGIKKVYKVTDTHCSREIALAEIKEDVFNLAQAVDFVREVQLTAALEHPNIIRIYDIGIDGSKPWFTMELTSNKTLADYIKENPNLALSRKLNLFLQVCDAIQYAHKNDILHLDLKPENISIGAHDQLILCDWGISTSIAKRPDEDLLKGHTLNGYIKGSLGYMAPEQTQPTYEKSKTSDIFGLGSLLHFILTGEPPYEGTQKEEILKNTKLGKLKSMERKEIPTRLVPLLLKSLSPEIAHRYRNVNELIADVEQFQNGYATEAEQASLITQLKLFYQRNALVSNIASFSTAILIGFTTYYIHSIKQSEADAQKQKLLANESAEAAHQALTKYEAEKIALNKANTHISGLLLEQNQNKLTRFNFTKALESAKIAHEKNPTADSRWRLGFTYFIMQDYALACSYLENIDFEVAKILHSVAYEYKKQSRPIAIKDYMTLITKIPTQFFRLHTYLVYQSADIYPPKEHVKVIFLDMERRNRNKKIFYNYNPNKRELDLSKQGDINFKFLIPFKAPPENTMQLLNPLNTIPLRKIRLKDTPHNRHIAAKIQPSSKCKVIFVP